MIEFGIVMFILSNSILIWCEDPRDAWRKDARPESAQQPTAAGIKRTAIRNAVQALVQFKREFNRDLSVQLLAELYVALELDLLPASSRNQQGFDLVGADGKRYQVKQRGSGVLNVDLNNFEFDFVVFINLAADYFDVATLPVQKAQALFAYREKFRKHQATQKSVKRDAEVLSLSPINRMKRCGNTLPVRL